MHDRTVNKRFRKLAVIIKIIIKENNSNKSDTKLIIMLKYILSVYIPC